MFHTHSDSDNQEVPTHDDSLPDVNIKVGKFYLCHLSENDRKGIFITAETEKSTVEKRISLELEHPDHFGLILLNYKGPESDDYFPLYSTVKVKEILLKKPITESDDSDLEDQLKNTIDGGTRRIITRKETDCYYLCEEAIEDKYTVILQMKLEIIDTNNSFRRLAFYLDDGSGVPLCRAIMDEDMERYAIGKRNMKTIEVLLNLKFNINARNEDGHTPLHVAVDSNMSDVVDLLIREGADVNATNGLDQVPLHIAARNSNLEILNSLLNNQAKLDEKDRDGRTALHYAVDAGNLDVVDILLKRGVDYKLEDRCGLTPFQQASKMEQLEMMQVFLHSKLNVNAKVGRDSTPLHHAVAAENENVVDFLISIGVDVNTTNKQGQVPLHYAAKNNNLNILNSLLDNQAKLDERDEDGQTPLYYAVFNGNENVVDFLISKGANVNILDDHHQVPLHYAAKSDNLNILDSLLRNQANLNTKDKNGRTPLFYAVDAGNVDVVDILLKRGADYELEDRWGHTPFHLAAKQVNLDIMKVFLDNNIDANLVNSRKQTPLHAIVETNATTTSFGAKATDKQTYLKIINTLLKRGANINFQDKRSNTPLHNAIMNRNSEFIKALLGCNADPDIESIYGDHELNLDSQSEQSDDCVEDILDSNVDIDAVNRNGDTALHLAIEWNDYSIVRLILKKHPNINIKNKIGNTALHKAVKLKHCYIVDLLLIHGANVDLQDKFGRTALLLAAKLPGISIEIIESILNYTNDVDAKDGRGRTALHYAALNTDDRTLELLLKAKADVNVKDSEGNTPLHLTMSWKNGCILRFESMLVLVNYQDDVNAVDNDLMTPLHHACWYKNVKAVKYLIKNGADCSMRDRDGRTVFHYACMVKKDIDYVTKEILEDLLDILVEGDVSVNCVDKFGKTPLHYVIEESRYRYFDLHKLLLKIGANINIEDKDHNTAIDIFLKRYDTLQYRRTQSFMKHVIKMKEMGMWVREKTLDKFNKVNDQSDLRKIEDYTDDCRKEIDSMNTNIDESDITYYNFLKKSSHKAVNYTRNQKVVNAIKSYKLLKAFPNYGHFLKCHLRDIQQRRNSYKKIQRFLKSNIFERLPMDCMYEIFQYLNNSDLTIFLQALKPGVLRK